MSHWFESNSEGSIGPRHKVPKNPREKVQALSLAKECYAMKMELLTNATVVDDAVRFVTTNVNNKGSITRKTVSHETEINNDTDMRPFDLTNGELQEQEQEQQADNRTDTRNNNQVF